MLHSIKAGRISLSREHGAQGGKLCGDIFLCDRAVHDFRVVFNQHAVAFNFFQKRARPAVHRRAEFHAVAAVCDGEGFHCAGDADVEEPALLIDRALCF